MTAQQQACEDAPIMASRIPAHSSMKFLAIVFVLLSSVAAANGGFFDDNPATHHAPPDPALTDLDLDVLLLCGQWGSRINAREFESMMLKDEHRETLDRIFQAVGGRIFSRADDRDEFVRQLRRAWFQENGFKHVFCGEPGVGKDLGGFHYAARYWQAQDEGWATWRPLKKDHNSRPTAKCRHFYYRQKIRHPIYNISVRFKNPEDPRTNVKCITGYHYEMHAERLLIAGIMAFKQANKRVGKNAKEACLHETRVPGVDSHYSTLVISNRAIRTFYAMPDRRPYCRKNKKDPRACLCSKL